MVKPLTVYKASAGSGKTFALAVQYIKLVVQNPQSYRNILAVTFTNKATEEMKTRILSQLYGIWKMQEAPEDYPESVPYMKEVCRALDATPQFVSERAGIALSLLLHNYNHFRVMTIDTFFQSVLRNLARELDLTANLRISLNDSQVEEMAVDQMIDDLQTTDVMLQWILKYIMENINDDRSWNVIGQIKQFGKNIFGDYYKDVSRQLDERLQQKDFFDEYTCTLRDIRETAQERMLDIAESFFSVLEEEGLTVEDLANKRRGIASFFLKLQNGQFDESIENQTVANCLGNPEKWYTKSHPRRELLHTLADGTLGDILRFAVEERPRQWRLYQSATLTLRHLNQVRLLSSIEKKVRALNEESNQFLLSDTQKLLNALINDSDSPFIFEKIGTQLEHVMIDEFQDTSTVQWQNFRVLLQETMSHQGSENLIVGDVKQSIYRWRNGDWRLLNDIEQQFTAEMIHTEALSVNRRSERNIVAFNNAFFTKAAELEYDRLKDMPEADQLQRAYQEVEQAVPDEKPATGLVSVQLLPAEDYQEQTFSRLVETVIDLRRRKIPQDKIAILVRVNSHIPLIANYFAEHCPEVNIVSDEAFRLDASSAVNIIVQALQLLAHPDDQLARAFLERHLEMAHENATVQHANSNCGTGMRLSSSTIGNGAQENDNLAAQLEMGYKKMTIWQHNSKCGTGKCQSGSTIPNGEQENDHPAPKPEFWDSLETYSTLPLYELAEQLFADFHLDRFDEQSAYVCAFFDQLTSYTAENTATIEDFLKAWDDSIRSKTIQSDVTDGVRIISIHKSKGLEFDYVLLPFCDWQLEKSGNVLWCHPDEAPFNELPIAPIDYSQSGMMGTIYEDDYHHEHLQNVVDNLNLLYVAFTRARRGLFVTGKRGTKNSRSKIIEEVLMSWTTEKHALDGISLTGGENEKQPLCFEFGNMLSADSGSDSPKETKNVFLQPMTPVSVKVTTHHVKAKFRQSNQSLDFISGDDEQAGSNYIQMGNILHHIFSTIHTTADIDNALHQLEAEGIIYDDQLTLDRITTMLRRRLEHPQVADWFSDRWQLFNECSILHIEEGVVVERRPDRVMTDGHEWVVVDFKFGHPHADYHDQVRSYMQLLRSMGHERVRGYLWYVYSNKIEEVR